MTTTTIEWADSVWNPVRGCSLVSDGCRRCYAMKTAHRYDYPGGAYEGLTELGPDGPRWNGNIMLVPEKLDEPLKIRKPTKFFVNSMSDLFHDAVPFEFIDRVFAVMALCPQHVFQILTKRPERMREYFKSSDLYRRILDFADQEIRRKYPKLTSIGISDPAIHSPKWIWLGVSVENQEYADKRIPLLLQTPAAVRFVSYEPALAAVDFSKWIMPFEISRDESGEDLGTGGGGSDIDWLIVGGESGSGARPFNVQWARDVIAQCKAAGVACFVKQLGHYPHDGFPFGFPPIPIELRSRKGGDMSEWPAELRVREFPC